MQGSLTTIRRSAVWLLPVLALLLCVSFATAAWHHHDDDSMRPCGVCMFAHSALDRTAAPVVVCAPTPCVACLALIPLVRPASCIALPHDSRGPPA